MPNTEPNPNKIRRRPTPDSPPPPDSGARRSPDDRSDWEQVAHAEADAQQQTGDAVPATHGGHDSGGATRPSDPPRADS